MEEEEEEEEEAVPPYLAERSESCRCAGALRQKNNVDEPKNKTG